MTCPFRAHVERHAAAEAAKGAPRSVGALPSPENGASASEYRLMLAALGEDIRQLHGIQSVEDKVKTKRSMIDRYRDWLAGALEAEKPTQDEIVSEMLVWAIDIAEWPLALALAHHIISNGLETSERYRRTPGTLIAENVAEASELPGSTLTLETLLQVDELTGTEDMPDQVRAKLKKAIGLSFKARVDAFDPEADSGVAGGKAALVHAAKSNFERALQLDAKSGVKVLISQMEKQAKQLAAEKNA